jgi:segregation and condensation protein B
MTDEDDGRKPEAAAADEAPAPNAADAPPDGAEAADAPTDGAEPPDDAAEASPIEEQEPRTKGPSPARVEYDDAELTRFVEALLFVAQRPLTVAQVARPLRTTFAAVRKAFRAIGEAFAERGIRLIEVAGGFQLRTAPECADVVRRFMDVKPLRLSKAAMETLAVVAYRQPVTKPDVDEIRGVDSGSAVKLLLDRNLVRILGRKEEPGRPLLYGTTQPFLEFFGLTNLNDLPSLREYAELSEDGRRQLERDLFARAPDALPGDEPGTHAQARHWEDMVEVLGDDLGGLPEGVEIEPEPTGDPLADYLLATRGREATAPEGAGESDGGTAGAAGDGPADADPDADPDAGAPEEPEDDDSDRDPENGTEE